MAGDADQPSGLHFAGVNTWLLIRYLREHEGPDAAARAASRGRRHPQRRRPVRHRVVELLRPVPAPARGDRRDVRRQRAGARRRWRPHRSVDARDDRDAAVARLAGSAARHDQRVGRRRARTRDRARPGAKPARPNGSCASGSRTASRRSASTARGRPGCTRTFPGCSDCAPRSSKRRARATARPRACTASAGSPTTPAPKPSTSKRASRC